MKMTLTLNNPCKIELYQIGTQVHPKVLPQKKISMKFIHLWKESTFGNRSNFLQEEN